MNSYFTYVTVRIYDVLVSKSRVLPDASATAPAVIVSSAIASGLPPVLNPHVVEDWPVATKVNKVPVLPSTIVFVPDTSAPSAVVNVKPVQPVTTAASLKKR